MRTVRLPLAPPAELPSGTDLPESAEDETPARLMQIGDLAKETGRTVRAIHLDEELGLLTPAARSKGRYRLYGRESLVRIRWIGRLQEMGFSLGDIQTVVREWERIESAPGATRRMREVYARKLEETREQMRRSSSSSTRSRPASSTSTPAPLSATPSASSAPATAATCTRSTRGT